MLFWRKLEGFAFSILPVAFDGAGLGEIGEQPTAARAEPAPCDETSPDLSRQIDRPDLIDALDSLGLARIAPAMARTADIIALPTTHKLGALAICMKDDGGRTVLGYTEASPNAEILTNVTDFARDELGYCAWRVING